MFKILNLTQHLATPEQEAAGVVNLPATEREIVQRMLTLDAPESFDGLEARAYHIAAVAAVVVERINGPFGRDVMIGGAPCLMSTLERALIKKGLSPLYSFSRRESVEHVGADGVVHKTSRFKHVGWQAPVPF